jgi:hypothetical protein
MALLVGIGAIVALFVFAIPSLTEDNKVEVRIGDDRFDLGLAETKAPGIDRDGPVLFSDVGDGNRDIFVQHLGATPDEGWYAFDARRSDQSRECTYQWDNRERQFVNPCGGASLAPDGTGLRQYPIVVDANGRLLVDLRGDAPPPGGGGTTTSTSSSTTSSSIAISGER